MAGGQGHSAAKQVLGAGDEEGLGLVSGLREGLTTDETGANALVNQHGTGANSLVNCMGLRANSLVN